MAAMAVAGIAAASAAPASAATAQGSAAVILASHAKGRTLSGQGVTVQAGSPATKDGQTLSLPISAVDPGTGASATAGGWLRFKQGKGGVTATKLHFDFAAGTLQGKLGGEELAIFKLGTAASLNASSGAVSLQDAKLRLTPDAADALEQKLGLERALRRDGVGMAWLSAKADPKLEAAKAVTSGNAAWGVRAAWRGYVLSPPAGSISIGEGTTATGPLTSPATTYGFPATGGSYEKGLYGASDKLVLNTAGSVTFAKPGHCIMELKLADLVVTIDGANSSIVAKNTALHVDGGAPPTCPVDLPATTTPNATLAKLDPSGVTPTYSADGKTVTWTAIPGVLTAGGEAAFGKGLKEGAMLDPITIAATIG